MAGERDKIEKGVEKGANAIANTGIVYIQVY